MKMFFYSVIVIILLNGCYRLQSINYKLAPDSFLSKVYPNLFIKSYLGSDDTLRLLFKFHLGNFDSIKVINLVPVLNKKDTMYLISGNFNDYNNDNKYKFYHSESIFNSKDIDLIIDCIFYKKDQSRRYTDTVYLIEDYKYFKNQLDYIFPKLH